MHRIGKPVKNVDREFNRTFKGTVIDEVSVIDYDAKSQKPRYEKFLEIIKWEDSGLSVRFSYYDRGNFQRRPMQLSLSLFEKLLNNALDKGILRIENGKISVKSNY